MVRKNSVTMAKVRPQSLIPIERIAAQIYLLRGQKVMFDFDLAKLYGVTTGALNQAVTRNRERFPEDFMFQLSKEEFEHLRSQFVISSWGGRRYPPRAFTQEGVAMLSGVLRSKRAVAVNIAIMRTFVRIRQTLETNEELARKVAVHDQKINLLFEHVRGLLESPESPEKSRIGFRTTDDDEER